MGNTGREDEWLDYYRQFKYITPEAVRDGSHPRKREHTPTDKNADKAEKAIVLIHGLTDSPYYMTAIADYFFEKLGYNVYLPLLRGHGLKHPKGMIRVRLRHWLLNVNYAVKTACQHARTVSIGGLSAGGALSFYTAATNRRIDGDLYLFSAALDIAGGPMGLTGELMERLLRTPIAPLLYHLDKEEPFLSQNPYKYSRMDKGGAIQLGRLIKRTDRIVNRYKKKKHPFPTRIFAAHSPADHAAHIAGVKVLRRFMEPDRFTLFITPPDVIHSSLVLKEPVYPLDPAPGMAPLVPANPVFDKMMEALAAFERHEATASVIDMRGGETQRQNQPDVDIQS